MNSSKQNGGDQQSPDSSRPTPSPLPDFTVHGELSDSALEALAALLIENYEREEEEKKTA